MLRSLRKFLKSYWFWVCYTLISLFCYISVFINPKTFWPAVFSSYAIPVVAILNLGLLIYFLLFKRNLILFALIVFLSGIPYMWVTFSFNTPKNKSGSQFSILSFNAKFFRQPKVYNRFSLPMIDWAAGDTTAIKCFQEYSTNSHWAELDVSSRITSLGYQSFIYNGHVIGTDHNPGMAIFSKYPIIDSGYVWKNENSVNAGIFADLLVGEDTLRVYNVHMKSMNLRLYQFKEADRYSNKLKFLISSLKKGAERRSVEIDLLIQHTSRCKYPFVIVGDFNETPYSYNYFKMRSHLTNAFETVGRGIGFSFNSMLFFLRIDHQFYGNKIEALDFKVDRSMKLSDHFPTKGMYVFR